MELRVDIKSAATRDAFTKARAHMEQALDEGLDRGAREFARAARQKAPSLFSNLINSIRSQQEGHLHYAAVTGVNHARMVEEGTGPAAGRKKYYPNPDSLQQFLVHSPRYRRHPWAKKGSRKRGEQELDLWFRSRALAWYIYNHGTKASPYMGPALKENESRVMQMIRMKTLAAARGVFGQ